MKKIALPKGKFALVDDADYEWLSQWKWSLHSAGYAYRRKRVGNKQPTFWMHREINDTPQGMKTDHVNGTRLDNRRINLRTATDNQNSMNRTKTIGTTEYKGVSLTKQTGRYRSVITINKKQIHLGYFDSKAKAAKAYNSAAKQNFGEFAKLKKRK